MTTLDIEEETVFLEKTIQALQRVFDITDSDADIIKRHFGRWRGRLPQHKNVQIAWGRYMQGIYGIGGALKDHEEKSGCWQAFLFAIREIVTNDYTSPPVGHVKVADSNGEETTAFGVFNNYASY